MATMRCLHLALLAVLLFVDLGVGNAFFFGDKNKKRGSTNGKNKPRRRLMEVPPSAANVDVDAATGTVKHIVTEEERAAQEASKTCDGQMAQALVAANDAKAEAENARDIAMSGKAEALVQVGELHDTIGGLKKEIEDLRNQLINSASSQDEAVKNAMAISAKEIEELKGKLVAAGEEKEAAIASVHQKKANEMKGLEAKLAVAEQEKESAVAGAVQEKEQLIASLQKDLQDAKTSSQSALEGQGSQLRAEHERQVAQLQEQIAVHRRESERVLQAVKDEAKDTLEKQVGEISKKDDTINRLKEEKNKLSTLQEELVASTKEMNEEMEHWRSLFANRSYCNTTHIANDIYESTKVAYAQAAEAASAAATKTYEGANVAATEGQKLARELSVQAGIGYDKSVEMYNEQHKKHWPKIKPHYEKHVSPLVKKFLEWKAKEVDPHLKVANKEIQKIKKEHIDPLMKTAETERKKLFSQMVKTYGVTCSKAHKGALDLAKKHDLMEQFNKVGPTVKDSCKNAEDSVMLFLRVSLVIILWLLSGRIFSLTIGVLRLALNIFLTVTLIRFCLPRRTKKTQASFKGKPATRVPPNASLSAKRGIAARNGRH